MSDYRSFLEELRRVKPRLYGCLKGLTHAQQREWIDFVRASAKTGNRFTTGLISQLTLNRISK